MITMVSGKVKITLEFILMLIYNLMVFSHFNSLGATMTEKQCVNSIGMKFARIESGSFMMGNDDRLSEELTEGKPHLTKGDFDERPVHRVTISQTFHIGIHEVTNAQYEQFDPKHKNLRGKLGFSSADDEAVVFVNWHDAVNFCEWLSEKEDLPYRLPTEAEWEYACRAGSTTAFHVGDSLPKEFHKNVGRSWFPDTDRRHKDEVVSLAVGQTTPNVWGIYDMHGNVEEWCYDWYGAYEAGDQVDPIGRGDGDFRVTCGEATQQSFTICGLQTEWGHCRRTKAG